MEGKLVGLLLPAERFRGDPVKDISAHQKARLSYDKIDTLLRDFNIIEMSK